MKRALNFMRDLYLHGHTTSTFMLLLTTLNCMFTVVASTRCPLLHVLKAVWQTSASGCPPSWQCSGKVCNHLPAFTSSCLPLYRAIRGWPIGARCGQSTVTTWLMSTLVWVIFQLKKFPIETKHFCSLLVVDNTCDLFCVVIHRRLSPHQDGMPGDDLCGISSEAGRNFQ